MGTRVIPRRVDSERDCWLKPHESLGHALWTAGLGKQQYFWCQMCSAYTGERARKLTRQCDKKKRYVQQVQRLTAGNHPTTKVTLDTRPRRLTREDVGDAIWSTIELNAEVSSTCVDVGGSDNIISHPLPDLHHFGDPDDPLGLGFEKTRCR